ncbi:MAG: hypothetical protein ACOVOR_02660 [Rhabdochlamydiaceae bacterium]
MLKITLFLLPVVMVSGMELEPFEGAFRSQYNYVKKKKNFVQNSHNASYQEMQFSYDIMLGLDHSVNLTSRFTKEDRKPYDYSAFSSTLKKSFFSQARGDFHSSWLSCSACFVPSKWLKRPVYPYHHKINGEVGCCFRKETPMRQKETIAINLYSGLGISPLSSSWNRTKLSVAYGFDSRCFFDCEIDSYIGFGKNSWKEGEIFKGYAKLKHRSLNLNWTFTYLNTFSQGLFISLQRPIYEYSVMKRSFGFCIGLQLPFTPF